ncbi:hypothetical protein [Flaviaesturariibacter amylovorans]|uniref:DUF2007 domain-containing protein n=1 Tax=Flaviaesturariibacter amylovorans TaxID=1084520 RepID=A0ABP8HTB7_9BACT
MSTPPFATFRSFTDPETAAALATQLREAGITVRLRDESSPIDTLLTGGVPDNFIQLQLDPRDFATAQAFLEEYYRQQLHLLPADYYLFGFSNTELREIIEKPDEWNPLDYVLAQKLLADRGLELSTESLRELKTVRLRSLAQPKALPSGWRPFIWILALFYSLPTLLLGLVLYHFRRTLPDGSNSYVYTAADRSFGKQLAIVSALLYATQLLAVVFGFHLPLLGPWSLYITELMHLPL